MKKLPYEHSGLVKGDTKSLAIAMASIWPRSHATDTCENYTRNFLNLDSIPTRVTVLKSI